MKKKNILNRIAEIVKSRDSVFLLRLFGTVQNKFNSYLFVNKRGSISIHDDDNNLTFPLSKYSKNTLSSILCEIEQA